MIALHFKNKL